MAANHSRENRCQLEVAARKDGTILAFRATVYGDMGGLCADPWRASALFHRRVAHRTLSCTELSGKDPSGGDKQDRPWNLSRAGAL